MATKYFARTELRLAAGEESAPTLVLDAIRADWHGFRSGVFALTANMDSVDGPASAYWRRLFESGPIEPDPLVDAPIVRIELAARSRDAIPRSLSSAKLPWLELETGDHNGLPGLLFEGGSKGLFDSEGVEVQVGGVRQSRFSPALSQIFDMRNWPNAEGAEVEQALGRTPALSQVLAIDVGQGGANALIDTTGTPRLYFDVGAGMGRHAGSTPPDLTFCVCKRQPIVLSHWDTDHWAGARADPRLLSHDWIAPRQLIGPTHTTLANDVLQSGGRIMIYASKQSLNIPLTWERPRWGLPNPQPDQWLSLLPCTGKSRNDSGLAMRVRDMGRQLDWLLTGDASYDAIPASSNHVDYAAVTASHHGAKQPRVRSRIPIRAARVNQYARLLYSYAMPNDFGHPHPTAIRDNANHGWQHGRMFDPDAPIAFDALATGLGDMQRTRASVAAGWRRRPLVPKHLIDCVGGLEVVR